MTDPIFSGPYRTPDYVTGEIRDLCRELDPLQQPVFVRVDGDGKLGECFPNVLEKVRATGVGGLQHGWNIQIWPRVLLDAQFHGVYISPSGTYSDVTRTEHGADRILFLPDSHRVFVDQKVPNRRIALTDDPDILEFIALTREKDQFSERDVIHSRMLTASEAPRYLEIQKRRAVLFKALRFRYAAATGLCPCGSGKKFKHCHGRKSEC